MLLMMIEQRLMLLVIRKTKVHNFISVSISRIYSVSHSMRKSHLASSESISRDIKIDMDSNGIEGSKYIKDTEDGKYIQDIKCIKVFRYVRDIKKPNIFKI
jgi:hypothetical protein